MTPQYVAKKSAWSCISFFWILSCILIVPLIILIFRIITVKQFAIEFYADRIIIKSGWLNTHKKQMVFMGITSVVVNQSLWGKIFNYGTVMVDCVGQWDVRATTFICDPNGLEAYLQTRIVYLGGTSPFVHI